MTKTFVADEILTASDTNAYLVNRVYKMTPTSVAGSGVSIGATGSIVMANATTVNINGVFTSNHRFYRILFDATGTASIATMTMRVAGVDSATGYDLTENIARNTTVSSATTLNQTSWALTGATGGNTTHAGVIELFDPFVTRETRLISHVGTHANPAASSVANALRINYGTHRPTTSYDGFTLTFSAAVSGQVQVFGTF